MAVVDFQLVAIPGQQSRPVFACRDRRRFVTWRTALLVRHFQRQQKRQLLYVIAVGQAVVAENVAVVPEFLNESSRAGHASVKVCLLRSYSTSSLEQRPMRRTKLIYAR